MELGNPRIKYKAKMLAAKSGAIREPSDLRTPVLMESAFAGVKRRQSSRVGRTASGTRPTVY
eukprot:scaffold4413_cov91-Cylindrotheca_fusiformis.AAC.2